jgi:23S rRNA pseudouridine2605 synthase
VSPPATKDGERVAKLIARSGLCSRREAERLVAQGRVAVGGRVLDSPAIDVLPGQRITVDGEALAAFEPPRLWRFHKPRGMLTSAADPAGRPTIYDALPPELPRVMPVGRLDMTSEGLLLLTNDGGLKRRLELPATGWIRRYRVRVHGRVRDRDLEQLAQGMTVEGIAYGAIQARLDRQQGGNAWLTMALREGKNREIRRVCEQLGWQVSRLIRSAYGPFQLGKLAAGEIEEVPAKVLREQLGAGLPEAPTSPARGKARGRPKPRRPGAS